MASVTKSKLKEIEIIIVNDGSTDETKAIAEKWSKEDNRITLINTKNRGVSHARNIGVEASITPYIAFLDSDDTVVSSWFLAGLELLQTGGIDVVYSDAISYKMSNENTATDVGYLKFPDEFTLKELLEFNQLLSTTIVRKTYLTNGFDETLKFFEDWELWIRLKELGAVFFHIPDAMVSYRQKDKGSLREEHEVHAATGVLEVRKRHLELFDKYKVFHTGKQSFEVLPIESIESKNDDQIKSS